MTLSEILKRRREAFARFIRAARIVCQAAAASVSQRRRQRILDGLEAERLDRIRNPLKYLGKS